MLQSLLLGAIPPLHDRLNERVQSVPVAPTVQLGRRPAIWQVSPNGATAAGNVTVVVSGVALVDYGDVRCRFCSAEVRGYVLHSGAISCIAPPISAMPDAGFGRSAANHLPRACTVAVTTHGPDGYTKGSTVSFTYFNLTQVTIATMEPSGGPVLGGTLVRLKGTRFDDYGGGTQGPKCRFGTVVVPATVDAYDTARCLSPPVPHPPGASSQPIWFTLNGNTDEGNSVGGLPFRYAAPATLSEVHPLGGPSAGGQVITVRGVGFVDDAVAEASCPIDDKLFCEMHRQAKGWRVYPEVRPGVLCVFESRQAHNTNDDAPPPTDDYVAVPATIKEGAWGHDEIICKVPPDVERLAQGIGPWCTHHGISPHCDDPAYAESSLRAVTVRVTLNGNHSDASPTSLVYLIHDPALPRLHYSEPWGGPEAGGTLIHIVGEDLLALGRTPLCRFGHIEVPVRALGGLNGTRAMSSGPLETRMHWHDRRSPRTINTQAGRLLTCESPPGRHFGSRWVRVRVSLDGEHYSQDTVPFRYTSFAVSSIHPFGGTLSGGTAVVLSGRGFQSFGKLACVFGETVVQASRMDKDPNQLRCISPASTNQGLVVLSVTVNGKVDSRSLQHGNATFAYFDESTIAISSLSPSLGPVAGGMAVTLRGAGFALYGTPMCRFGDSVPVRASYNAPASPMGALFVGRAIDELICYPRAHTPSNPEARDGGDYVTVSVSLSGDATDFLGDGQLGLKWIERSTMPTDGPMVKLQNLKLSQALRAGRRIFSQSELDQFGLRRGGDGAHRPHDVVKWYSFVEAASKWFTPAKGPSFFFHHPCHGRNKLSYYPGSPESAARDAVERYLAANNFNMSRFDVDGNGELNASEVKAAIDFNLNNATADTYNGMEGTPSQEVLDAYASSSCFLPTQAGDRKLARATDLAVGYETGGLILGERGRGLNELEEHEANTMRANQ